MRQLIFYEALFCGLFLIFALPILISNIFQQLYNTADVMIVGRFLGPDALAAVGASSAIFDLVIGFALGVGNGMALLSHVTMVLKTTGNFVSLWLPQLSSV